MYKITQNTDTKSGLPPKYTLEYFVYSKEHHDNQLLYVLYNLDKALLAKYLEGENVDAMAVLENTGKPVILTN